MVADPVGVPVGAGYATPFRTLLVVIFTTFGMPWLVSADMITLRFLIFEPPSAAVRSVTACVLGRTKMRPTEVPFVPVSVTFVKFVNEGTYMDVSTVL